jgi:hypothetical protein
VSEADRKRLAWCRAHRAHTRTLQRQLNRRPPYRYETVWCVDWYVGKNGKGDEIVTWADWGTSTKRQAINKAMKQNHHEFNL